MLRRKALLISAALLMFGILAVAGSKPSLAADDAPGLGVGEKAPSFTLKDQHGEQRTLEEFLEDGKVVIVFYRSASW